MSGAQPPAIPAFMPGPIPYTPYFNTMAAGMQFLLDPPVFRAKRTTALTIATGHQYVPWNSIIEDTYSGGAAGSSIYTVQAPGQYLVSAAVSLSGTGASGLQPIASVAVNGSSPSGFGGSGWEAAGTFVPTGASTQQKIAVGSWIVYGGIGDQIQIDLYYSPESTITAVDTTSGNECKVDIVWFGV